MSATCYYCGWWTDINGVCVCGYSGKPTTRSDSCVAWKPQTEIVTNAERIRAMSDKELARFLYIKTCEDGYPQFDTIPGWLKWLKDESKNES